MAVAPRLDTLFSQLLPKYKAEKSAENRSENHARTEAVEPDVFESILPLASNNFSVSTGATSGLRQSETGRLLASQKRAELPMIDNRVDVAEHANWRSQDGGLDDELPGVARGQDLWHEGHLFKAEEATISLAPEAPTDGASNAPGILDDMADFLTRGYWGSSYGDGTRAHNVSASGVDANNGVLHYNVSGWANDANGLTAERAELVRESFKLFEATLGIQFVESSSQDTGFVDFFFSDNDTGAYASSSYTNSGPYGATLLYSSINLAQSWSGGTSTYNDYTLQTILHEIGHALGLGHQGPYNGSATYGVDEQFDNDSWQASMMSYFSQTENTTVAANYEFLQTPMSVDWLALDEIYGRQGYGVSNAFTEDTTWGFNTTVTSDVSDIWAQWSSYAHTTASTIIDGGGQDTLDLSGFSNNTLINLAPSDAGSTSPSVSNIGGSVGNLTIGVGTIIENAIGGAGSEIFYGNAADNDFEGNGGNDTFHDSTGNDTYHGGAGTDSVIFNQSFGSYLVELAGSALRILDTAVDWVWDTVEWLTFSDQTLSWQAVADSAVPNSPPVAVDDAFSVAEDAPLSGIDVLANDTDAEGDALGVAEIDGQSISAGGSVVLASGAIVTLNVDGTLDYDQNGAFSDLLTGQQAVDSFDYVITDGRANSTPGNVAVTINGITDNVAPIAADDAQILTEAGTAIGNVLVNDTDPNGDSLAVVSVNGSSIDVGAQISLASGAHLTLNADGSYVYDPNGAFDNLDTGQSANDTFTYGVSDGNGGFDTALVTLTISGISPTIITEAITIDFEGLATGQFTGQNGLAFDGIAVAATSLLAGDAAGASGNDGSFTITATGEDFDLNALSGIVASGRTKVMVQAYDDGALVGSQQLNLSARKPLDANFDTTFDSVDQVVFSANGAFYVDDIDLITRTSDTGGNQPPNANDDSFATDETAVVSGNLLANDSDPDGGALNLVSVGGDTSGVVTLTSGGTVTFSADGTFSYYPNGAFDNLSDGQTATDTFSYVISDGQGGTASGTATISISGIGVAPTSFVLGFESGLTEGDLTVTNAVLTSANPGVANGAQAASSIGDTLNISSLSGDTFEFNSGVVTLSGKGRSTLNVEGFIDGTQVATESFNLRAGREEAINLSDLFDNVDEVVLTASGGLIVDDLAFFV